MNLPAGPLVEDFSRNADPLSAERSENQIEADRSMVSSQDVTTVLPSNYTFEFAVVAGQVRVRTISLTHSVNVQRLIRQLHSQDNPERGKVFATENLPFPFHVWRVNSDPIPDLESHDDHLFCWLVLKPYSLNKSCSAFVIRALGSPTRSSIGVFWRRSSGMAALPR